MGAAAFHADKSYCSVRLMDDSLGGAVKSAVDAVKRARLVLREPEL